ncbi:hypothetical protein [Devosia ginsengisoli]|uniref:hypothetical protein n=1 Tax=Devosia ginsengisoli TaxID=400770 RepID=UPI0026F2B1BD|nr:hypothetical protein [Devosia ginsengisoli]MCR6673289.1 hypothetical protein [Devosia ginsengisoli]
MANDIDTIDPATGEVMTLTESNQPLAVQLAQAELNQAVTTAKAFPRDVRRAVNAIMALATLDEETAAESVYALPRGGKPIKGPSVRFAEIVASQYGNCHTGSRVVAVDKFDKVVVAEGVFLDLETGMKRTAQIRRRIVDRQGRLFNDDMIVVTGNAAASIAMREAILKGIPKAVWRKAYEACEAVIAGDVKTLNERRERAVSSFAIWGIKPEQIFAALDIEGIDNIGLDELATLTAMHKAIKTGEQKPEDYFPAHSNAEKAVEAAKGTAAKLAGIADQGKPKADPKTTPKKDKADAKGSAAKDNEEKGQNAGEEGSGQAEQEQPADGENIAGSDGDAPRWRPG